MAENIMTGKIVNVNTLGYFLDGWADLIEGMGGKEKEVQQHVLDCLKDKGIKGVWIEGATGITSVLTSDERPYILAATSPGATTAIYIGQSGKDLYAAWRTFISPVLNQNLLIIALIIAGFFGLITGGIQQNTSLFGRSSQTTFSFFGWIFATLLFAFLIAGAIAVAGKIWRGNYLWFFFLQPSLFDADDITAMSLAAHKTVLRALDNSGIDISKLRLKRDFKGGRRDETI